MATQVSALQARVPIVVLPIPPHQHIGQALGFGVACTTPHEQRRAPVEQLYLAGVPGAAVRPAMAVGVGGCIVRGLLRFLRFNKPKPADPQSLSAFSLGLGGDALRCIEVKNYLRQG